LPLAAVIEELALMMMAPEVSTFRLPVVEAKLIGPPTVRVAAGQARVAEYKSGGRDVVQRSLAQVQGRTATQAQLVLAVLGRMVTVLVPAETVPPSVIVLAVRTTGLLPALIPPVVAVVVIPPALLSVSVMPPAPEVVRLFWLPTVLMVSAAPSVRFTVPVFPASVLTLLLALVSV